MKKSIINFGLIFAFLLLFNISLILAEIEMNINFHQENFSLENKKISLKNLDTGMEINREIHDNKINFALDELLVNEDCQNCIPTISAILCSGGEHPCSGYLFYFPLDKKFGKNLQIELFPIIEYSSEIDFSPTSTCSDVNLIYCSQFIFSPDKKYSSTIQHQWGNFSELNGIKTCNNLAEIPAVEGLYFFEAFCSDGLNSVLKVQPFFQKTIIIENPYDDYVIAKVNLSKTSCVFEDGSKINDFKLNPNENLPEIISCYKEDTTKIEINFFPINNPSFSLISIGPTLINICLIGGISLFLIFIYKKLKKTKKQINKINTRKISIINL